MKKKKNIVFISFAAISKRINVTHYNDCNNNKIVPPSTTPTQTSALPATATAASIVYGPMPYSKVYYEYTYII